MMQNSRRMVMPVYNEMLIFSSKGGLAALEIEAPDSTSGGKSSENFRDTKRIGYMVRDSIAIFVVLPQICL